MSTDVSEWRCLNSKVMQQEVFLCKQTILAVKKLKFLVQKSLYGISALNLLYIL